MGSDYRCHVFIRYTDIEAGAGTIVAREVLRLIGMKAGQICRSQCLAGSVLGVGWRDPGIGRRDVCMRQVCTKRIVF